MAVGVEGWRGFRAGNLNADGSAGKHPASKRKRAAMGKRQKVTGEPQKQGAEPSEKGSRVSNGDYGTSPMGGGQNEQNKNACDQRVTAEPKTGDASPVEGPDANSPSTEPATTGPARMLILETVSEVGAETAPKAAAFWDRVVVPVLAMIAIRGLWRMFVEHLFASWKLQRLADLARAIDALRAWPDQRAALMASLDRHTHTNGGTDEGVEAGIGHELVRASFYRDGDVKTRLHVRAIAYAINSKLRAEPEPKRHVLAPESEAQRRLIARLFLTADHVRAVSSPRDFDPACEAALLAWLGERPWDPTWNDDERKVVHDYAIDRLIVLAEMMVAPNGLQRPAPLLPDYVRGGDS